MEGRAEWLVQTHPEPEPVRQAPDEIRARDDVDSSGVASGSAGALEFHGQVQVLAAEDHVPAAQAGHAGRVEIGGGGVVRHGRLAGVGFPGARRRTSYNPKAPDWGRNGSAQTTNSMPTIVQDLASLRSIVFRRAPGIRVYLRDIDRKGGRL